MSTVTTAGKHNGAGPAPPPSVFLQPIAPPVSIGLFGFFLATTMLATWILGWWGTPASVGYFFVFSGVIGGLVQFLAGVWCFKARDYIASGLITMWGTYWMAFAILQGLGAGGVLTIPPVGVSQPAFAIWFIPLGLFTLTGAFAALSREHGGLALFALLFTTGVGTLLFCIGTWLGSMSWIDVAAWWLLVCGCLGWYVAAMFMMRSSWERVILPFGRFNGEGNLPGQRIEFPTEYLAGDPGVRQGGA